ncbi:MAG: ATP-binding cassette domain-containing protein, partial [Antricoccus sp.]
VAYSARGFGKSTGQIELDAVDAEVADAQNVISMLGKRADVIKDGPDDPRVGMVGASYGGALALITAGVDKRVDAIVPQITWNRLSRVFFPDGAGMVAPQTLAAPAMVNGKDVLGAFKREWAGIFFGLGKGATLNSVVAQVVGGGSSSNTPVPDQGAASAEALSCGRFAPDICAVYQQAATTGTITPDQIARLDKSSVYSVADKITAPTLLMQGQTDTLFPLSEADVTARQIAANGTPVRVHWVAGGHDAGGVATNDTQTANLRAEGKQWFDHYLKKTGPTPAADFSYDQQTGLSLGGGRPTVRTMRAPAYPGIDGAALNAQTIQLRGPAQPVLKPPSGVPASISTVPGLGAIGISYDPPGQAAIFSSNQLVKPITLTGSTTVNVKIAGITAPTTLFAKIYDAGTSGAPTLLGGIVVPVVIDPANGPSQTVPVVLPAIAHTFEKGHRIVVAFASTDRAYPGSGPQQIVQVGLADSQLTYQKVSATADAAPASDWLILAIVIGGALLVGGLAIWLWNRRNVRREVTAVEADLIDVPLVARGLRKAYKDGFVAVSDVGFRVEREQVVGLLGPNGAGKTTALRMLMGLITPTDGELRVFGHQVQPGAPVLSRLGCFVEGVGFLPHLNGKRNIELYWQATGRPADESRIDEVLQIAGLGDAISRKVNTYSQGMRQRLAIAQAMLGMPDLLVLDEPTNGLDPPQIAEMRQVLRTYARDGRAVLVSSHQLAEVEQTCSHVVVVNKGAVIAQGTVDEVVGVGSELTISVDDPSAAEALLRERGDVRIIDTERDQIGVEITSEHGRAADLVEALVRAGIGVDQVVPRRRLEDAFLALVGESG